MGFLSFPAAWNFPLTFSCIVCILEHEKQSIHTTIAIQNDLDDPWVWFYPCISRGRRRPSYSLGVGMKLRPFVSDLHQRPTHDEIPSILALVIALAVIAFILLS